MAENKNYAPISAKEIQTKHGKLMKLSFRIDKLAPWANAVVNDKGYVNLCITPRKTEGKYGETHCVWLDTYTPRQQDDSPSRPATDSDFAGLKAAVDHDKAPF